MTINKSINQDHITTLNVQHQNKEGEAEVPNTEEKISQEKLETWRVSQALWPKELTSFSRLCSDRQVNVYHHTCTHALPTPHMYTHITTIHITTPYITNNHIHVHIITIYT